MELLNFPKKPKTDSFTLNVPYNWQNDNSQNKGQGHGSRHCNATCAAMLAKYLKPPLWTEYSDFANGFLDALRPYGDTTDHHAVTLALRSLGIESYFSYTASREDLAHSLFSGVPAIMGTNWRGSGHMILAVGRTPKHTIAHDPYGSRAGSSHSWAAVSPTAGKFDRLSNTWLSKCVFDLGSEQGWIRFVTAVDGQPTGVKAGL